MNHFWKNALDSSARRNFLNAYHTALLSFGHVVVAQTGILAWMAAGLYLDNSLAELNSTTRRVVQEMREFQMNGALVFLLPVWQIVSSGLWISILAICHNEDMFQLTTRAFSFCIYVVTQATPILRL